jgi:hypothetical protein
MVKKLSVFIFFVAFTSNAFSQTLTSQILDAETQLPVPYATVQTSEYNGVMTNDEGVFNIVAEGLSEKKDSITISSLGYKTLKIPYKKTLPSTIQLTPDIYEIIPVLLTNRNMSAEDIMDMVMEKKDQNYSFDYQKSSVFIRQSGFSTMKKFKFTLTESTIDNINQKLLDDTFGHLKKKYVYLNETLADAVIKNHAESKLILQKALSIQNKEELASGEKLQEDFMKIMNENFKSDSQLILKSGIIRLDKTESIDSIQKSISKNEEISQDKKNLSYSVNRTQSVNSVFNELFLNKKSDVDFLNKPGRYNFVKNGFANYEGDWLYIIDFEPDGSSGKYKGKLYIDAFSFAIVKAEIWGANDIFDKHLNLLGIKANTLTYKSTVIFKKENEKYILKYLMRESSKEAGIDRPLTVVEKNENVKGKKRINKVEVQMDMHIINLDKIELVFDQNQISSASVFENLKPNTEFESTQLFQYDTNFWNGYNILTPEKAIQEIVIEE